ncbi:MAG: phosphodiesterase, partial [Alphaproteobacteria bacterium]
PTPLSGMKDFVQYEVPTDKALVVALDMHKTGSDAGEFCQERYDWLGSVLKANSQKPAILFMHHHPMPLGLPMQDTENMQNGEEFLEFVSKHKNVKQLCIGHVHRAITGNVKGIPFATMKSVLYQAPAPQPAWDWDTFAPAIEAPNIGVVTVSGSDVTLQYQQFCPYELGT